jgi:hypothetical protein
VRSRWTAVGEIALRIRLPIKMEKPVVCYASVFVTIKGTTGHSERITSRVSFGMIKSLENQPPRPPILSLI